MCVLSILCLPARTQLKYTTDTCSSSRAVWIMHTRVAHARSDANRRGSHVRLQAGVTVSQRHALFNGRLVHFFLLLPHARMPQRQRE